MNVKIERMDHLGNGIGYLDGKIIFVPKTVINDEVKILITKETKNYLEGRVIKYLKKGNNHVKAFCAYYEKCGGCHLQNLSYEQTCDYKKERVLNILNKLKIQKELEFIKNPEPKFYRNKITLQIKDGIIGFYLPRSHHVLEIDNCLITKKAINNFLPVIKKMHILNGKVLIRCNYNDELLVSINTLDDIILDNDYSLYKVVGIVLNDKCIYGEDHFLDQVQDYFFEVSYDAFFQVNSFINEKLFDIIKDNVAGNNVLDLYSGVGTLAIMASAKAKKVYAIEINENAVLNAIKNAKINNINNITFLLGDAQDKIKYITDKIDMITIDPPRGGLSDETIKQIIKINASKLIYISCETQKFSEDLKKLLPYYDIQKIYALDMFSYTYHVETIVILKKK